MFGSFRLVAGAPHAGFCIYSVPLILELDLDNLPTVTRCGLCHLNLGKHSAAKEDLTRALRLYPGSSLVKEALGRIERGWDAALERERQRAEERGQPTEKRQPVKKRKPRQPEWKRQLAEESRRLMEARCRLAEKDKARRQEAEEKARKRAAEEARRRIEKVLRTVEKLTGFKEVYALGVAAS